MTHPCGIRGCSVELPAYLLFCPRHWSRLPLDLRRRVNATYRRFTRRPEDPERLIALREVQREARELLEVVTA